MKKRGSKKRKKKRKLHKTGKKLMHTVLLVSISLIIFFMLLLKKNIIAVNTSSDISLEGYVETELKIVNENTIFLAKECFGIPITISQDQTESIFYGLNNLRIFRPGTHDLISTVFNSMEINVEFVKIRALENNTYFADLVLKQNHVYYVIDARPSDAIAIAVRNSAKVYVKKDLLNNAINICREPIAATQEDIGF